MTGRRIREIPPGLLQHVLSVLVFWSWVLLLPRLPPSSRSLRLFPWASILFYGPLDIAWICCPQLLHHPCKNGTHSTCFYSTGGHTPKEVTGRNEVTTTFFTFGHGGALVPSLAANGLLVMAPSCVNSLHPSAEESWEEMTEIEPRNKMLYSPGSDQ